MKNKKRELKPKRPKAKAEKQKKKKKKKKAKTSSSPFRRRSDTPELDVPRKRAPPRRGSKNLFPFFGVDRRPHVDPALEPPWAEQGGVDPVRPVGRRDDNDGGDAGFQ